MSDIPITGGPDGYFDEEFMTLLQRLMPFMTIAARAAITEAVSSTPTTTYRPATVQGVDLALRTASVKCDGDEAALTAQLLTEIPGFGDRVMVEFRTAGAVFVTGFITACGIPPGSLMNYGGAITAHAGAVSTSSTPGQPPRGWLWCAGQAVSRSTYGALFTVIGTTWGSGDGATTFNVPDLRGRTIIGLDNMGGSDAGRISAANTLGGAGGSNTISQAMLPNVSLSVSGTTSSDGSHTHSIDPPTNGTLYTSGPNGGGSGNTINNVGSSSTSSGGAHTHTFSGSASTGGSGSEHLPPYALAHILIKS